MTTEEYIKDKLQDLGKAVDDQIPPDYGFILLVFPFGQVDGIMQYIANCKREDAVQAMREWIAVTEKTYATDQGEQGKEGFLRWYELHLQRHRGAYRQELPPAEIERWCYDAYMAGRAER
jgi:hypothetical protein